MNNKYNDNDDRKPLVLLEELRWHEKIFQIIIKLIGYGIGWLIELPHLFRYGFRPNPRGFQINTECYKENDSTIYSCAKKSPTPISGIEVKTFDQLINMSCKRHADMPCMGRRPILRKFTTIDEKTGKELVRYEFGDYIWKDYKSIFKDINNIAGKLMDFGFNDQNKLALFCNTSPDWLMMALSLFKISSPFVTIYSTLSDSSVLHALNLTEAVAVMVDERTLPRIFKMLDKLKSIKTIIVSTYLEKIVDIPVPPLYQVYCCKYDDFINYNSLNDLPILQSNDADSLAVIMFTSGSTGVPKGVMLSHKNLLSAFESVEFIKQQFSLEIRSLQHVYAAFLPSSHIFEFLFEIAMVASGYSIGFCTPLTLFDESPMVQAGCKGDLVLLRPTVVITVPLLLDRIKKGVLSKLKIQRRMKQVIFQCCYEIKMSFRKYGIETPFLDHFVFKQTMQIFGGRLVLGFIGGSLVPQNLEEFSNICLGRFRQGYGLTETCSTTLMVRYDYMATGTCGSLLPNCEMKLAGSDNEYSTPYHTGEIAIAGSNVCLGYYKNQKLTNESFVVDEYTGKRWFYTGDIGMVLPDLTIKIVDRKKDIIKLLHGEYISLVSVENVIMESPLVELVCVLPNKSMEYLVAVIVPQRKNTTNFLVKESGCSDVDVEDQLKIPEIRQMIASKIESQISKNLSKQEYPKQFVVVQEYWTSEQNMVTPTLKIKRPEISKFYSYLLD